MPRLPCFHLRVRLPELGAAMIAEAVFQSGLGSIGEAAAKSFSC